ncbi:unnamed protein product [Medioppia subpectinata]|uniref:MOSC domain-containing protein n=1 Tax=Medioppia subpectinata TaxID=1979941 RepID=A0A7R9KB86_9ACAR|nr:unnamed protein product [Medioppia subpectinata]CAG2100210.1 unnamed protein product [Medioppia subpectinata]
MEWKPCLASRLRESAVKSSCASNTVLLSGLMVCVISGALLYVVKRKRRRNYVKAAKIIKLIVYPVKSLPGIEVDEAIITKFGLQSGKFRDRMWLLINDENRFVTQRTEESLALLRQKFGDKRQKESIVEKKLKIGIKLIQHMANNKMRPSSAERNDRVIELKQYPIAFHDGSAVLVINQNSINDLNAKLPNETKVSYRNFRPNILITGCDAFAEDYWKYAKIRDIEFTFLKACDRCVFTTINPDTGVKMAAEPLSTLRTYRLSREEMRKFYGTAPLFGINLGPESEGVIHCRDIISAVSSQV